jgi:hypothetical protein
MHHYYHKYIVIHIREIFIYPFHIQTKVFSSHLQYYSINNREKTTIIEVFAILYYLYR